MQGLEALCSCPLNKSDVRLALKKRKLERETFCAPLMVESDHEGGDPSSVGSDTGPEDCSCPRLSQYQ